SSFLRRQPEPLVLLSTGAGFAPVWSMAIACVLGQPTRPLQVIVGAREASRLYMGAAVEWLRSCGVPVAVAANDGDGKVVSRSRPSHLLPVLSENHIVHAAGTPLVVGEAYAVARTAGATFYSDPFYPSDRKPSFAAILRQRLRWSNITVQDRVPEKVTLRTRR